MSNNEIIQGFDDEQDQSLTITLERMDTLEGCLILALTGSLNTANIPFFQKQVVKAVEAGYAKLIFQCRGLTFISSTGISSFSQFLKLVRDKGGALVFFAVQPHIQEVFHVLGFAKIFTLKESLEEALGVFRGVSPEFPQRADCPVCGCPLPAEREGHFRCSQCKTALALDSRGQLFLG